MLTKLNFDDSGKIRIDLIDGTTMSVITPERRAYVDSGLDQFLNNMATLLGLSDESMPIPDGKLEVAFVHPEEPRPLPEVMVAEWQDDLKVSGTWTLYYVTEEQILDYANKVGVKS